MQSGGMTKDKFDNCINNTEIDFIDTFKNINFYLKKFKINAWMDAGLLLKYSRGQDIFPSSDIDFGIKSEDIKKLVLFSEFTKNKQCYNYKNCC